MASHHGNTHSEPAVMNQIIVEFFAKSLHIILDSRCPSVSSRNYSGEQVVSSPSPSSSSSSSPSFRARDKWHHPGLKDLPAVENIDFWRQNGIEPMIVDVILVQRPHDGDPLNFSPRKCLLRNLSGKERDYYSSDNDEFGSDPKNEKIIERWILQYESRKNAGRVSSSSGSKRSSSASAQTLYKKSIVLLRSLYATVRLLPAYKLFRDLISSAKIRLYNLRHRISSFVEPFTHREEVDMQRFAFTPIDTSCGRLCLSVWYSSSVLDVSSEPSTPISPQFISEYVGSPLAEPLKRFPSGPVSQCSPSTSPFGRRHSWSYDLYRASPPSANPSPSPTYSEPNALSRRRSSHLPPAGLPCPIYDQTPIVHMKNQSYDEYLPFPMLSPSPSPSPPTNIPANHIPKALLRCESAPVSIPASKLSIMPALPDNRLLPCSSSMKADSLAVLKEAAHSELLQINPTVNKLSVTDRNDEQGLEVKTCSPPKMVSRNSSRLFIQDDYDDIGFSGPFVVDDDEFMDTVSRPGQPSGPFKKSQDATVGALVFMLNKAPPLHLDTSMASRYLQGSNLTPSSSDLPSSGLAASKTTADALEELRTYSEMKDLLLKQGKSSQS